MKYKIKVKAKSAIVRQRLNQADVELLLISAQDHGLITTQSYDDVAHWPRRDVKAGLRYELDRRAQRPAFNSDDVSAIIYQSVADGYGLPRLAKGNGVQKLANLIAGRVKLYLNGSSMTVGGVKYNGS